MPVQRARRGGGRDMAQASSLGSNTPHAFPGVPMSRTVALRSHAGSRSFILLSAGRQSEVPRFLRVFHTTHTSDGGHTGKS